MVASTTIENELRHRISIAPHVEPLVEEWRAAWDERRTIRPYQFDPQDPVFRNSAGAVAIVPLFDDGRILLERQFRYPHGREFIEIPAGKLEPGETAPAVLATRADLPDIGLAPAGLREVMLRMTAADPKANASHSS